MFIQNTKSNLLLYNIKTMMNIRNNNFMRMLLIITILYLKRVNCFIFRQVKVTPSSFTINEIVQYKVQYLRSSDQSGFPTNWQTQLVPSGSTVTLTFPSQYTLNSSNVCAIDINFGGRNSVPCPLTGRTFTISNIISSNIAIQTVTVWVQNVKNPTPAILTQQFKGSIGNDDSGAFSIDSKVQLQPATVSNCQITFNPSIVNTTTGQRIIFKFTPLNQLGISDKVVVVFPNIIYARQLSSTNRLPISGTLSCTNENSNVRADIVCQGTQVDRKIQFTNVFLGVTSTQFSFSVRNFLSPPTTQPADAIKITTYSGDYAVDTCTTTISGLVPKTINVLTLSAKVTPGTRQFVVNQQYILKFSLTLVDSIREDDYFEIDLPSGSVFNINTATVNSTLAVVASTATFSSNKITIRMTGSRIFNSGQSIYVDIGMYTTPPSTKTTAAFTFKIMKQFYQKQQGTVFLTPVASSLTLATPTAFVKTVNAVTSYRFVITTIDPISQSAKIVITIPSSLKINFANNTNCASVQFANLSTSTPICQVNTIANRITIKNLNLSNSIIPAQTMIITVQGIQNPTSTQPTLTFRAQTYYTDEDDTLVAEGTSSLGVTPDPGTIDSNFITITPSSDLVLDSPVSYNVKFTINNPVPAGGFIILAIPKAIAIAQASVSSNCRIGQNNGLLSSTACNIDSSSLTHFRVTFSNPFTVTAATGTVVQLQLRNVCTNPRSTEPVGPFGIQTYSDDTYLISSISSGLFKNVNTAAQFRNIDITKQSNLNYAITSYTFSFSQDAALAASSIVRISLPTSVQASAGGINSQCTILSPSNGILFCTVSGQSIRITLPSSQISVNTNVVIRITQIRNPFSFAPLGSFTLETRLADDSSKYCLQIYNPNLANSETSNFLSIVGEFTPRILNTDISLKITFTPSPSAALTPPSFLQLTLPITFIVGDPSTIVCSSYIGIGTPSCTVLGLGSHTIRLSGTFTSSQMSFTLSGFKSGTSAPNGFVSVITLDSSGTFKIDQSNNNIQFFTNCTFPCKFCQNLPTQCTGSCYTSAVSTSIYLDEIDKKCYDFCPNGRYQETINFKCADCDQNCLTCEITATNCQTCNTSSAYRYLNTTAGENSCVEQCILGMYPQDATPPTTCMPCIPPCKTCTTDLLCLSCLDTYFYLALDNSCKAQCPNNNTYVENTITDNCDACNVSCLTCQLDVDNCTSCLSPLIYYDNKCYVECPAPLVPKLNTCGPCDSPCDTCSRTPTNCTSCLQSSARRYLNFTNNECVNQCPINFYEDAINGKCAQCSLLGRNCVNCDTAIKCNVCDAGYFLYTQNYTCIDTILPGYVNIAGVATLCTGDCATCSINTGNCTSCITLNLHVNECIDNCLSGFVNVSKVCQTCLPPCRTCQETRIKCTACLTTLIPDVFLHQNQCLEDCPSTFFANQATQSCANCIDPCQTCSSLAICQTCVLGKFFYNGACNPSCVPGYVGINRICRPCLPPCKTCENNTNICLTCDPNTYLLQANSSCVGNCGNGLYIDILQQKCISCTDPCRTCVNTTDTCLSCISGILQNNVCLSECPGKKFQSNGRCADCPVRCSTCTSLIVCTACVAEYYLYLDFCIIACPETHAVIINGQCIKCGDQNCHKCTSADVCTDCSSDFSLLNGKCFGTCPTGYQTNGTHCLQILNQTLTTTSDFPVPFTIASGVAVIACLMSKLQFSNTFVPGAIFSLICLCEVGALGYFLYLYFLEFFTEDPFSFYIGIGAAAFLYLLNILALFIQTCFVCYDYNFKHWLTGPNKCVMVFVTIIATAVSHKFRNILFCKLFSFSIFSAQLQNVSKFRVFNVFAFLSLLSSAAAIFAGAVAITKAEPATQLFYECIDVIVVHGLMIVIAFFNVMKPDDFFQEKTLDGYYFNKKFQVDSEQIENKIKPAGEDEQNEIGQFSDIKHALVSNQPFRVSFQNQDSSIESLSVKHYEQISVQCLDMLNQREHNVKFYDESDIEKGMPDNSKFTTIFDRTDKSIQNYIQNSEKAVQRTLQHVDQSAQGNYANQSNKSIQPSNKDLHDKSAQRTVFYQDEKSLQFSQKKASVREQSQDMSKYSFKNRSIQKQESQVSMKDEGIQNYPMLEDQGQQAMQTMTDKENQKTISVNERSIQMGRSTKSYEVQMGEPESVEYKQYTGELQIQSGLNQENVIFEQEEQHQARQLGHQNKDQLLLPNEEIKNYQEELQDRIREKEKELDRIKYKIMLKEKDNQQRKKMLEDKPVPPKSSARSSAFVVDVGKIYKRTPLEDFEDEAQNISIQQKDQSQKMPVQSRPLKQQHRHVGQQQNLDEQSKTIQEIQIIDDPGHQQYVEVDFNNDQQSKQTEEELIDMLEGSQDIVYDQQNEGSARKQQQKVDILKARNSPTRTFQLGVNQQSEQESGKGQNSTKINSSIRGLNRRGQRNNQIKSNEYHPLKVSEVDYSLNSHQESINDKPLDPHIDKYRSDREEYQRPSARQYQPNKDEVAKQMRSTLQIGFSPNKKIPQDVADQYVNKRASNNNLSQREPISQRNTYQPNERSQIKDRNTLLLAGKSQFTDQALTKKNISKGSPLKTPKRWQYENQDKNLSDSGEYEVPNLRSNRKSKLAVPFETDRQETEFRHNENKFESHHKGRSPIKRIEDMPEQPTSQYPLRAQKEAVQSHSQFQELSQPSVIPVKPKISHRQPYVQESSQLQEEPYIDDQSDYANQYKNGMLMDQLMERPQRNDDLKQYYKQSRRRSKDKEKSHSRGKNSGLEKIYLQRMDRSRKQG